MVISIFKKKKKERKEREIKKEKEKKISPEIFDIIIAPHITEKSKELEKENKYVFKVLKRANKIQIKEAIEKMFKVKVVSVKIIKIPSKERRFRGISGRKSGYKKAIVKIKEGEKISLE